MPAQPAPDPPRPKLADIQGMTLEERLRSMEADCEKRFEKLEERVDKLRSFVHHVIGGWLVFNAILALVVAIVGIVSNVKRW